MSAVEDRLVAAGIVLPKPKPPVANYAPFIRSGNLVHISGQISVDADGRSITGLVGTEVDLETAKEAARICGINLLSQMRFACDGDLDRVRQVVKLNGFVQVGPEFFDIPPVLDGASDLMVLAFGDKGRHARCAVGVYRLPLNFSVEIDAVVEVA